jgi:glycosyltransferase involved in cell wall biosynthesis
MTQPTISVIIPTVGRKSIERTLDSIRSQQIDGDEIRVVMDHPPHNDWGAWARNQGLTQATGDMIAFIDDDDRFAAGAFNAMRREFLEQPGHVHIFKMFINGTNQVLWKEQDLSKPGQVGAPMIVVPNQQDKLGRFTSRYQCDFDFLTDTVKNFDGRVRWHEDITSLVWPARVGVDDPEHSVVMDRTNRSMKWA